jgi:hypothetical protein
MARVCWGNSKVIIEKNIVVSALRKKKREEKEMYLGLEKCLEPLLSSPFSDLSVAPSVDVVCRRCLSTVAVGVAGIHSQQSVDN